MRIVYLALIIFLGFMAATCNPARGAAAEVDQIELPYPEALSCVGINKAIKVDSYPAQHQGKPYFVMEIDTNEDGKKDGLLIYRVHVQGEDTFVAVDPTYLVLDENYDGQPDHAYEMAVSEKFSCNDMKRITLDRLLKDHKGA